MAAEQNVLYGLMIVLISGLVGFAVYLATCGCKKDSGDTFKKIKYTTRKPAKKEKFDPPTNKMVNKQGPKRESMKQQPLRPQLFGRPAPMNQQPLRQRESMKQQPLRQRESMKQQPLRPQLFGRPAPMNQQPSRQRESMKQQPLRPQLFGRPAPMNQQPFRQREPMMVQAPLPTIDLYECPCTLDQASCPDGCTCSKCETRDFEPAGLAKSIVDTVSGTVAPEIYTQMHIPFGHAIKSDSRWGSDFLRGDLKIKSPPLFVGQQTYQESLPEFAGGASIVFGIINC